MFTFLASCMSPYNAIEYIYGHYLTLTCTEWNQLGLHSPDGNC